MLSDRFNCAARFPQDVVGKCIYKPSTIVVQFSRLDISINRYRNHESNGKKLHALTFENPIKRSHYFEVGADCALVSFRHKFGNRYAFINVDIISSSS